MLKKKFFNCYGNQTLVHLIEQQIICNLDVTQTNLSIKLSLSSTLLNLFVLSLTIFNEITILEIRDKKIAFK
jgi:hypothetical protein